MSFYDSLKQTQTNVSVTENGMVGYKTTYHPLLDMNFKISSYRHMTDEQIKNDVSEVLKSTDATYILKFLFYVRDVRNGLGERRLFRVALKHVLNADFANKNEVVTTLIKDSVAKFGRFDDLFIFIGTPFEDTMYNTVLTQLRADYDNMSKNKPVSLLAKWMPSENASSKETKKLAHKFMTAFGSSAKEYRKLLSALRSYLKVTEVFTSSNAWDEIDYNTVPSKANLKYKDAFLAHDEERRRDYLAALRVGVDKDGNKVKINSSVNYPHEIVAKYCTSSGWYHRTGNYDEALEQLWKNLKDKPGLENTVVVRDGSGSMTSRITENVSALDVSTGLAIYCAERLKGDFKNKFITFSARAKLVELPDTSLQAKLLTCDKYDDCSNTNLANVFNLILNTAVDHNMTQDEIPSQILIISDMEFDGSYFNGNSNVIANASKAYAQHGYKLPKLVFWNVNSRTNTIPCKQNDNGLILVSGFSVNVLDMVLSGKTDPFETLVDKLMCDTYNEIPLLEFTQTTTKEKKVTKTVKKVEKPSWL